MAEKNVSVRLVATGGGALRAELVEIGKTGDAAFDAVGTSATSASAKIKGVGAAAKDTGAAAGALAGGGLRQTTMQLSQVAQQASATGNWLQAFAIQLPDLALAFGPVGIAAGAIGGALLMLVPSLLGGRDAAKELADTMKVAEASTGAMSKAAKAAAVPVNELRDSYGDLADNIDRSNDAMAKVTAATAAQDALTAARALSKSLGSDLPNMGAFLAPSGDVMAGYVKARAQLLSQAVEKLGKQTGATADQALRLANAISQIGRGGTMQSLVEEADDALAAIAAITPATTDQQTALGAMATQVGEVMDLAKQNVEGVRTASDGLVKSLDTGIARLNELKDGLRNGVRGAITGFYQEFVHQFSPTGMSDRYLSERASGQGGSTEELVRAVTETAGQLGIAAKDLLAVMSFETGGKLRPDTMGPTTKWGQHFGLIQFGEPQGAKYGVSPDSSITQQVVAAGKYLQDAGVKAGDGLANIYAAVLAGDARKINASDLKAGGVVGNVTQAVTGSQFAPHIARAEAILGAYGGVVREVTVAQSEFTAEQKKAADELKRGLDLRRDFVASLEQQVMAAALEAESVGRSAYEQARLRAEVMLTQDARAKGIALTEQIKGSEKTYGQAIAETADALGRAAQEQVARQVQLEQADQAAKDSAAALKALQDDIRSGFHSAFDAVIGGTASVGEAFRSMIASILAQLAHAQLDKAITGLFNLFPGLGGRGTDPLGDALSAIPGLATGGTVLRGGWAMVGERGPELMRLPGGSTVYDAAQTRGAGMQNVHVTVGVDQRSGNLTAFVDSRVSGGLAQSNRALPSRVSEITNDPLRR